MPSRTAAANDLNRLDRRRARTRAQLLEAGRRLFAAKGFHGTKIADIAAAADLGTGTFYLHFPTKDALFADLVRETAQRALGEIDRAKAPVADPREKARVGMEAFFRFAASNREVFKILFGQSARFDDLVREIHQLFLADIEANHGAGIAAGVFTPCRPALMAQAIVGMLSQVVAWWLEHQDVPIDEITETIHRLLMHGSAVQEA